MPAADRDALVARLVNDITIPDDVRIAGLLVALYAQPVARVSRLQRHHIVITEHGQEPTRPVCPKSARATTAAGRVNRAARVAALHHLITHIPTAVLANLIGANPNFVADRAATLNTAWANYPTQRARTSTVEQDSQA